MTDSGQLALRESRRAQTALEALREDHQSLSAEKCDLGVELSKAQREVSEVGQRVAEMGQQQEDTMREREAAQPIGGRTAGLEWCLLRGATRRPMHLGAQEAKDTITRQFRAPWLASAVPLCLKYRHRSRLLL